jgi:prepilin-type N-terminal cleavage/methylation domain-containing protein
MQTQQKGVFSFVGKKMGWEDVITMKIMNTKSMQSRTARKAIKTLTGKTKKGFTLVEIIVVIVIIAILAAIAVPALTGYIDKANQRKYIAQARDALTAMQTFIAEDYGKGVFGPAAAIDSNNLYYYDAGGHMTMQGFPAGTIEIQPRENSEWANLLDQTLYRDAINNFSGSFDIYVGTVDMAAFTSPSGQPQAFLFLYIDSFSGSQVTLEVVTWNCSYAADTDTVTYTAGSGFACEKMTNN